MQVSNHSPGTAVNRFADPAQFAFFACAATITPALLLLTSPLGPFGNRRVGVSILLIASAVLAISSCGCLRQIIPRRAALALGAILYLGLASSAGSALPGWAMLEVTYYVLAVVAIGLIAIGRGKAQICHRTLISLVFGLPVLLYVIGTVTSVFFSLGHNLPLQFPFPVQGFVNIRFFNQYQTWVFPFLAAALLLPSPTHYVRTGLWRTLIFAATVFFWALLWRTEGRGTLYATTGATLLVFLLCSRSGRKHALVTAALAGVGFVIAMIMFDIALVGTGAPQVLTLDSPGRIYLWSLALELIKQHPWLGIGPMHFAVVDNPVATHPHNAVIQWAVEWGLPAAALMVAGLVWLGLR